MDKIEVESILKVSMHWEFFIAYAIMTIEQMDRMRNRAAEHGYNVYFKIFGDCTSIEVRRRL